MSRKKTPPPKNSSRTILAITVVAAVAFVGIVLVFAAQSVAPSGGTAGPKLVVDQERLDFGRVNFEKPVRAVFTLTNAGDQPLRLASTNIPVKLVEGC
jgi:hypothetical protein